MRLFSDIMQCCICCCPREPRARCSERVLRKSKPPTRHDPTRPPKKQMQMTRIFFPKTCYRFQYVGGRNVLESICWRSECSRISYIHKCLENHESAARVGSCLFGRPQTHIIKSSPVRKRHHWGKRLYALYPRDSITRMRALLASSSLSPYRVNSKSQLSQCARSCDLPLGQGLSNWGCGYTHLHH